MVMKMDIYNKTKENVARALGVSSFSVASQARDKERDDMLAVAKEKMNLKFSVSVKDLSSGSPYIMLRRKINVEGKLVK